MTTFPQWLIALAAFGYLGILFGVAAYAERRATTGRSVVRHPAIYALSLAVYCTSWTFYGSVGRAATTGVGFLPIYLGPTLALILGIPLITSMSRLSKRQRLSSLADLLDTRYGKSGLVGGLVTLIAIVGLIPYLSLQLKAISHSLGVLTRTPSLAPLTVAPWADQGLLVALLLALFAILFGTRQLDTTAPHEGIIATATFDAIMKLVAFVAVGIYVAFVSFARPSAIFTQAAANPALAPLLTMQATGGYGTWASHTLLSMLAFLCLPRQFQMLVVEQGAERQLRKAIWIFPLYLLAINLFVLPIALGGLLRFPHGAAEADLFVLALPMAGNQPWLALLAFLGGLSAAATMVVVETLALSTMLLNNVVMPLLLRNRFLRLEQHPNLTTLIYSLRRSSIVLLLLLSYGYYRLAGEGVALVEMGLVSFAAVAQFAPALIGGFYWRSGNRSGALVGMSAGFLVWAYTLLLPALLHGDWLVPQLLDTGPFGIELLRPFHLFGLTGLDPISHGLFWSMLANVGSYVSCSLLTRQHPAETVQATLFVAPSDQRATGAQFWRGHASMSALRELLVRFLGPEQATTTLNDYAQQRGVRNVQTLTADAETVHFAETLLASTIGATSARVVMAAAVHEEPLQRAEVIALVSEASQIRAYSHALEQKSLALEQARNELEAANERLQALDRLKDDFLATITHELRTPLTAIRAFAEILYEHATIEPEQRERFLGTMIRESERLTRLINQVLDLAKLESGGAAWAMSAVDMKQVVEESLAAIEQLLEEQHIQLDSELPAMVPLIHADQDRLIQVMLNLLSNAVKFCHPTAGRIEIALTCDDAVLRVDVRDNGQGINPADQQAIFEKFRQGSDRRTVRRQGTGLGLPISRQIITHLGGRLWVESSPGAGATFSFTLPIPPPSSNVELPSHLAHNITHG